MKDESPPLLCVVVVVTSLSSPWSCSGLEVGGRPFGGGLSDGRWSLVVVTACAGTSEAEVLAVAVTATETFVAPVAAAAAAAACDRRHGWSIVIANDRTTKK